MNVINSSDIKVSIIKKIDRVTILRIHKCIYKAHTHTERTRFVIFYVQSAHTPHISS